MRGLWRIALVIGLVATTLGASWATAGKACACSCAPMTAEETVARADAIVSGRAVSASESADGMDRTYVFQVDYSYKTVVPAYIEVSTASQGPACGVELTIGATDTVVLGGHRGAWSAVSCSNYGLPTVIPPSAGPRLEPTHADVPDAVHSDASVGTALVRPGWMVALWAFGALVLLVGGVVVAARLRK